MIRIPVFHRELRRALLAGGLLIALWFAGSAAHACGCSNQSMCSRTMCCGCSSSDLANKNPPVPPMNGAFEANGMELLKHVPLAQMTLDPNATNVRGSAVSGWTDPLTGKEYAIFGRTNGTAFLDITNPTNPIYLGDMPTNTGNSPWREMAVYRNWLYVVSDANGDHGMQVFDLTRLRGVTSPQSFAPNSTYRDFVDPNTGPQQLNSAHTIGVNADTGFLYLNGSNTYNGAFHIVSLANPANPTFVRGSNEVEPGRSYPYIHDGQSILYHGPDTRFQGKEIVINSLGGAQLSLVDVTDKNNLRAIAPALYAGAGYTHQGSFTDDHRFYLANDEFDELFQNARTRTHIWDMQVLDAPRYLGYYEHTTLATDHNLFVKGNLLFEANYTAGLRVFDLRNLPQVAAGTLPVSQALIPVGYFDTKPGVDQSGFSGAWHNFPYFNSGTILISDIEDGLFIVRLSNTPAAASFVRLDTVTGGSWNGVYGSQGYNIAGAGAQNPTYGTVSVSDHDSYIWAGSTTDTRALLKPGQSDRIAACWYSGSSFNIRVNNTDTAQHRVALYLLDWDNWGGGRQVRVEAWNTATNVKLGEQTVTGFQNGTYVVWNVQGDVTFRIVNLNSNAVVSGVFLDAPDSGVTASASFVRTDTTTRGNWSGVYGLDGYSLAGSSALDPSYASLTLSGQSFYQWAGSTTDTRALLKPGQSDRIAACWYTHASFDIRVRNTDANEHQVALYLLDWDNYWGGRQVRVEAWDTRWNIKLGEQEVSNFQNGTYLVWNVRGDVTFKVVNLYSNAVVSGVFFR